MTDHWGLRSVPEELARRYVAEGWWTDATLGSMVAEGLQGMAGAPFTVRSKVRPWRGTFADVDRAARSLAASLAARGIGAGDVVVLQLPNWVEAGVAFWAATYLGAVVIPVVHFYGVKEVGYILGVTEPDVVVTADRFGRADHLALYSELLGGRPETLWLVVGSTPAGDLPP
ncbi:MAG TPA: AMP-binding protein, partial [Acidimicrobiales bacterium]|nr:AMP-binding protein [Acidimicrobiales bacterium]